MQQPAARDAAGDHTHPRGLPEEEELSRIFKALIVCSLVIAGAAAPAVAAGHAQDGAGAAQAAVVNLPPEGHTP